MLVSAEKLAQLAEGMAELDRTGLTLTGTVEYDGIVLPIAYDKSEEHHVVRMDKYVVRMDK